MIISCPACGTRYEVPESAIGAAGRKLKCAACGHRWHVDGAAPEPAAAPVAMAAAERAAAAPAEPVVPPAPSFATMAASAAQPPVEASIPPVAPPLPVAPVVPPQPVRPVGPEPEAVEAPSPFDYQPPFEPRRRSGLKWLVWLIVVLAILAIGAFVAIRANVGGLGDRLNLAQARPASSPLVISFTSTPERRLMDSNNVLLSVAGRVTNPTAQPQRVPDIRAELRDAQGRAVYNWTIGAPVTRLAPGASADFNSAEVDVPAAARTIHLKPGPMPQV